MVQFERLAAAEDYRGALEDISRKGMSANRKTMLLAHYAMPDHIATMRYLAATVGYTRTHSYANLQYGGLAKQLRQALDLKYDNRDLWSLATWPKRDIDDDHEFSFRMRPEVATALELLGWTTTLPVIPGIERVYARAAT